MFSFIYNSLVCMALVSTLADLWNGDFKITTLTSLYIASSTLFLLNTCFVEALRSYFKWTDKKSPSYKPKKSISLEITLESNEGLSNYEIQLITSDLVSAIKKHNVNSIDANVKIK